MDLLPLERVRGRLFPFVPKLFAKLRYSTAAVYGFTAPSHHAHAPSPSQTTWSQFLAFEQFSVHCLNFTGHSFLCFGYNRTR